MEDKVKKFGEFLDGSEREKIILNGYEMWLDRKKSMLFDKEDSKRGAHFDVMGTYPNIWISSLTLTKDEKKELIDYIKKTR